MQMIFEKIGYDDSLMVFDRIAPSCEEMLVQCRWNGENVDCLKIFENSLTNDGLCCSFNYYGSRFDFKPEHTIFTGSSSGLSVTINTLRQKVDYSKEKSVGIKVTIHNSLEYPGFDRTFRTVSVGNSIFFQITANKLTNTEDIVYLTRNQRKCVFSGEKPLKYHHSYYFANCLVENYSRLIFKFCGCVPFYYTFSAKPKCSISQMECLQRFIRERRARDTTDINCPPRCENIIYKVFSSRVQMNNVSIALSEENKHKISEDPGVRINVFFTGTHTLLSRDVVASSLGLLCSLHRWYIRIIYGMQHHNNC
ncbi:sodium channel protein Nach-like isoform X2 [Harmonia axyridis]|uniref:sodium channel protein Nach-like isoform X2 n=1 Tax=Harmonia axyridis TaxID=115357 RepID=UPI001E277889|nr:sodium channel protein Nach-like isoform X2 [Harmonia axyridis]